MEAIGLNNQPTNKVELGWLVRIQGNVNAWWTSLWGTALSNEGTLIGTSQPEVFFSTAPQGESSSEVVLGNPAKNVIKEIVKMDNCNFNLNGNLVTVNGVKKADYAINLYDLDQNSVAVVQNKVLVDGIANSLGALATEYATQSAAA